MIRARFFRKNGNLYSVELSGHAGFAESGEDIVCASVSSAVQLVANGITECAKQQAEIQVDNNWISVTIQAQPSEKAVCFLDALHLHLSCLEQDFQGCIQVTVSEV